MSLKLFENHETKMVKINHFATVLIPLDDIMPTISDLLTPDDYQLEEQPPVYDYQEEEESDWETLENDAMESWHKKLHLAKLAAWMKAKAQNEASDLAANIMQMNKERG